MGWFPFVCCFVASDENENAQPELTRLGVRLFSLAISQRRPSRACSAAMRVGDLPPLFRPPWIKRGRLLGNDTLIAAFVHAAQALGDKTACQRRHWNTSGFCCVIKRRDQ